MAVGDKVYGTLFFRRKTLEWLVRDVRPALGALSPLRLQEALYFNQGRCLSKLLETVLNVNLYLNLLFNFNEP